MDYKIIYQVSSVAGKARDDEYTTVNNVTGRGFREAVSHHSQQLAGLSSNVVHKTGGLRGGYCASSRESGWTLSTFKSF